MMVLYQSLIRNLFRSLYNLSVSVLLLSASAKARKCQQEGPMATLGIGIPGTPRDGNGHSPEFPARGEGKPNFSITPQAYHEGHKWGVPHPQTLLPTGCYPALRRDPRPLRERCPLLPAPLRRGSRPSEPPAPGILHLPAQPHLCSA